EGVGPAMVFREVVDAGVGRLMAALVAESHADPVLGDPVTAGGNNLCDRGVLRTPASRDPRADALVIVHDRDFRACRDTPERDVEAAKLGEHLADPRQR